MSTLIIHNGDFSYPEHPQERFAVALFIALFVHAFIIFFVGFDWHRPEPREITSMQVTLVTQTSKETPENADMLAQANQEGGGNNKDLAIPTITEEAPFPDAKIEDIESSPPTQIAMAEKETRPEVMTSNSENKQQSVSSNNQNKPLTPQATGNDLVTNITPELDMQSLIEKMRKDVASIQTTLSNERQEYAKKNQRAKFISVTSKEHELVAYVESWRQKIERIAESYYPAEALRLGLSGELTVSVSIRADGTVQDVEITRPSRHVVLNAAAENIVKLAAPYSRFTPKMKEKYDVVYIVRRWSFDSGRIGTKF
jgi:protein TonB